MILGPERFQADSFFTSPTLERTVKEVVTIHRASLFVVVFFHNLDRKPRHIFFPGIVAGASLEEQVKNPPGIEGGEGEEQKIV